MLPKIISPPGKKIYRMLEQSTSRLIRLPIGIILPSGNMIKKQVFLLEFLNESLHAIICRDRATLSSCQRITPSHA